MPQFRLAGPVVEHEGDGLDRPVRWVFANEREDVANFLSGGEMLLVEGRSLMAPDRALTPAQYVDTLARAGVCALVVELVEGVTAMPADLLAAARAHGLTLVGLTARVPFVDLSQAVNTAIVRSQLRFHMDVDTMSTSLRAALSHADGIDAVAASLAELLGEGVAIFDADGLPVARAGVPFGPDADGGADDIPTAVMALDGQPRPVGALEVTQRAMRLDAERRRVIARIVSPVAALYIEGDARMGMIRHLTQGPRDGIHAEASEAREDHAMLGALGYAGSCVYMPFALRFRSVAASMGAVSAMFDDFIGEAGADGLDGRDVACLLEGDLMVGWFADSGSADDVVGFCDRCVAALEGVAGADVAVARGKVAIDTVALVDSFTAVRAAIGATIDIAREPGASAVPEPASCAAAPAAGDGANRAAGEGDATGRISSAVAGILSRFLATAADADMDAAVRMLTAQTIGFEVASTPMLMDTLCACFDNLDNKSDACAQLGVRRQTLYNRLDKVAQMTGIDYNRKDDWSMALFAAKTIRAWRSRR